MAGAQFSPIRFRGKTVFLIGSELNTLSDLVGAPLYNQRHGDKGKLKVKKAA